MLDKQTGELGNECSDIARETTDQEPGTADRERYANQYANAGNTISMLCSLDRDLKLDLLWR